MNNFVVGLYHCRKCKRYGFGKDFNPNKGHCVHDWKLVKDDAEI